MKRFHRNTGFNPERNMTTVFGDTLMGLPYDGELSGPDGMHFHVWVPQGISEDDRKALLTKVWDLLCSQRDATGLSWDYQPAEEKIEAKDWVEADLDKMMEVDGFIEVRWPGGGRQGIDNFSLSALKAVYKALNGVNKAKLRSIVSAGPAGLSNVVNMCFQMLKK